MHASLRGYVPPEFAAAYVRAADALLLFCAESILFSDGLHAGTPVAVIDSGDMSEIARRDGDGGAADLARAMAEVPAARSRWHASTHLWGARFCLRPPCCRLLERIQAAPDSGGSPSP